MCWDEDKCETENDEYNIIKFNLEQCVVDVKTKEKKNRNFIFWRTYGNLM
jgi:hypothetical protein